jgi:hypothetical protein
MQMLNWLLGTKTSNKGKSGIYKVVGDDLLELMHCSGDGSINSIIEHLGFDVSQIHVVFTFDSPVIQLIGVKIFTKEPVFVLGQSKYAAVDFRTVTKELRLVNWDFEYSRRIVDESLTEGITRKTFTLDFLKKVLELKKENSTIYKAPKIGVYLSFEDGLLKSFTSTEWVHSPKWLKRYTA